MAVDNVKPINYISDFQKNEAKQFVLSSDAFSSPVAGQQRWDSTDNVPAFFNGTIERNLLDLKLNEFTAPDGDLDINNNKLTNVANGTVSGDAVNYGQLLSLTGLSKAWREVVLHKNQLSDANDCILQAVAFFLDGQPTSGDTFVITDGTTTRTYGFGTGGDVTVTIGADADETMTNLASAITGDGSGLWDAVKSTALDSINDGSGSSTSGHVIVIYRADQTSSSYTDRIYGSLTTQANGQYVNFGSEIDYDISTNSELPSSDPSTKSFGFGRITADLATNETHQVRDNDNQYTWDNDNTVWNNTGTTGVTGTAPIDVTGGVVSLNYAKGLEVVSNNLEVKVNSTGGIVKNLGAGTDELGVDRAKVPFFAKADITGDGVTTTFTVTHSLGVEDVFVFIINNTTGENEEVSWGRNTSNPTTQVDLVFSPAPANGLVYTVGVIAL